MKKFMYKKANDVQFYDFTRVQKSEDMRIEIIKLGQERRIQKPNNIKMIEN